MHNPSRMTVIKNATKHLLDKINSCCPQCDTPGFVITNAKTGLTCSLCDAPTKSTLSFIYGCKKGKYNREKNPNKKPLKTQSIVINTIRNYFK